MLASASVRAKSIFSAIYFYFSSRNFSGHMYVGVRLVILPLSDDDLFQSACGEDIRRDNNMLNGS